MKKVTLAVQNIKCGGCAAQIEDKLKGIEGLNEIEVDVDSNEVSFFYEDVEAQEKVERLLSSMGYPSIDEKNDLVLQTKSYVSCMIGRMKK